MKIYIFILITLIALVSCNNNQTIKTERGDLPDIYTVQEDDAQMNAAIKTANETLDKFTTALKSNSPNARYFAIKTRYNTQNGGEHIWVSDITMKNNKFFGVVDNLPETTTDVKLGDTIEINKNNISDWMYQDNGKLMGGYSIRLLRNRMSPTERQQFDAESGLIIEE